MSSSVVIAGAGPTGLMLACELGLAGAQVVVIEPLPERSPASPGMAVNSGFVETLDQRGLMDPIREETFVLPGAHFSLIWLDLTRLTEPHADAYLVPQSRVERLLEERALSLGAEIRRGHEVVSLDQDSTGVTAGVRARRGDYQLRGDYLVGCDGANSTVRSLVGIDFPGTDDPTCSGITGDVEVELADMVGEHFGAYVSETGAVYTGAPIGPGLLRVSTIEFGVDASILEAPVTPEEFFSAIKRITGVELNGREPRWLSRFGNTTRQATRYRADRVFLAGDAAHVLFPVNGLGLCTGVQDVVNLGWKLAADLHGWAPAGLLDTYEEERYLVGRQACRDVRAQAALMYPPDRVNPLREVIGELLQYDDVQRHLIEMVTGVGVRYPFEPTGPSVAEPHPLLGRRLPNLVLRTAHGEGTVASTLYTGRGVLLDLSGGGSELADVSGWKDRVDVVTAEPMPEIAATALLLRPDGHTAWVGGADADGEGLLTALATWFGGVRRG
jgi:2-polyprenyl-6-methoxyphenol hydroxylase-like FAD-dependent oxidoreductase